MKPKITEHQLNYIIDTIFSEYESWGPQKRGRRQLFFDKLKKPRDLSLFGSNTIMSFKEALLPNGKRLNEEKGTPKKIALLGLNNCDVWAYHKLFKELSKT
jgi:hypothetical protein